MEYIFSFPFEGSESSFVNRNKSADSLSVPVKKLGTLNLSLRESMIDRDWPKSKVLTEEIESILQKGNVDSSLLAESKYYTAIYYKYQEKQENCQQNLRNVIEIKERMGVMDSIYSKALYNLGGLFAEMGMFKLHEEYTLRALEAEKYYYGENSPVLISTYGSLITAYIELNQNRKALKLTDIAYKIASQTEKDADPEAIAFLYQNIGVLYSSVRDYTKSLVFYEKSEDYYSRCKGPTTVSIINLYLNKSNALSNLGMKAEAEYFFSKGVNMAMTKLSKSTYLLLSDYAQKLAGDYSVTKGEKVLSDLIKRVEKEKGKNTSDYFEVLTLYADFLRLYSGDIKRALEYYEKSIAFFNMYGDEFLRHEAIIGKAQILAEMNDIEGSLSIIQSLLFPGGTTDLYANPDVNTINPDNESLNLLKAKYQILKNQFVITSDTTMLAEASRTAEFAISLLERIRISINEEESRLLLGNRFRDLYINIIADCYHLFELTGKYEYFEKAFEYSEKSKIAGLLASTRELQATEFHIPDALAEKEKELQAEIAVLNDRISGKTSSGDRNDKFVKNWKDNLFIATMKRDSLIKVFENNYPDYYAIKYNSKVLTPSEISSVIGRKANYLSYVVSDSSVYIGVINSRFQKFIVIPIDSLFFNNVKKFRRLLSSPDFSAARGDFNDYHSVGYSLFKILIEPVREYFISDRLIISPDNLLSYLPFETIPVTIKEEEKISYKDVDFLMDNYDISYTYSATFHAENSKRNYRSSSNTIAFAPDYSQSVNIQNIFQLRQQEGNILEEIPFAREEARYVSDLLSGTLVDGSNAKESFFKQVAGNYDIIHLAMHTVLDDDKPMKSTLIFSPDSSAGNDRFLETYEIYGIPLKARMVVLSSCNTGSGKLYSGEGILSLARGFIYSGSESVIMSMWEIEDRAGTEIVKLYYDYLKKGYTKSMALRKARSSFLKNADQLRAHPYFWSTLVVYGDNSAIFRPFYKNTVFIVISLLIAAAVAAAYGSWRRYS
jgi:CHAT domain-containing protein/tetratricopeptide (TPR) repeat protein